MLDWVHDRVLDQTAASRKPSLVPSIHTLSFPLLHWPSLKPILRPQDCELWRVGAKSSCSQLGDPASAQALVHSRRPMILGQALGVVLHEGCSQEGNHGGPAGSSGWQRAALPQAPLWPGPECMLGRFTPHHPLPLAAYSVSSGGGGRATGAPLAHSFPWVGFGWICLVPGKVCPGPQDLRREGCP